MYTRNAIMRDAFLAIVSLALVVPSRCYGPPQTHQQQQGPASDVNLINYSSGVKDYGVVITEDYSSSSSQSALPSIVPSSPETPTSSAASARYWWQDSPFVKNDQPSILPVPSTVPPVAPIELNIVSSDAGTSGVRIPSPDHGITQVLYPNNPFLNGEVQRKTHAYTIAPTVFTSTTVGVKDYSSGGIEPVSSNSIAPSGYPAPAVEHTNTFPTVAPTPYPGCAAALKCVPETYCNSQGFASDTPVTLTKEFLYNRVPLTDCLDEPTGIIGKCCRDPNYKDPWPADLPHEHGHDHGHEHGHEHEHEHEHQHTDSNNVQPDVAPKPTTGLYVIPISAYQPSSEGPQPPAADYGVPIGPYKPPPPPSPSPPYGGGPPQQPSLPPYQPQPTHPPHIFIPPYKPSFPPQSSSNYRPPPQQPFQPPFTPGGSQTYPPGPGSQPPHPGSGSQTYPGPGSQPPYPGSGSQTYPGPGLHPGPSPTFPPHLPTHPPPYGGSSKPPQPPYGISKPPHTIISPPQSSHPPPTSVYPGSSSHEITIVKPGGGSPPTYPGSPPPSYPPPNYIPSKPGYPTQIPPQYPSKPPYPEHPPPQYPTKPPYPEHPPPQYPTKPPYPEQPQPEYPSKPPYPEHPPPEYPSKPPYPEQPSSQYPTKPPYPEHPPPEYPSKPSYPEHPQPEYPSKPPYPEHPPPQYPTKPSYPEQPPPHYPSKPPHPEQPTPQYPQQPPTQYPYPQQPPTQYPYPQQPQYPQHPPPNYPQHPPPQYPQQPPTQYPQPAQPSYPEEPSQRFTTVQEVVEVTQAPAKYHIVNKFGGSCGTKKNDGTAHGNAPWHVIVYSSKNKDLICAGAIVSENAILTAAHCLDHSESESTEVKIGPQGKMYKVAAIARHSQYEPISFNRDLALVFLHEPIPSDEYVEKICLPSSITPQTSQAKDCYVSSMDKDFEQSTLEIMPVEVFPYKDCEIKLRNTYLGKYFILNDSFSCVSTPAEQELCSVKTGSPIACGRGDGIYELFGIKSWDLGCQQYKSSAIFSNADLIWIQNTLSTPLPKLSENEKARRKDKFRGESLEGVNIKEKPGFGQGYGK